MDKPLLRKYAAQMISEFALKVLKLKPDTTKKCVFDDISNEPEDVQYYIVLSCQLGIMGLDYYGNPDTSFIPDYTLKRDQFITVISRMLRWEKYNILTGEITTADMIHNFAQKTRGKILYLFGISYTPNVKISWYSKHLDAVKKLSVITDYNPAITETRGYVMVTLKRIFEKGLGK